MSSKIQQFILDQFQIQKQISISLFYLILKFVNINCYNNPNNFNNKTIIDFQRKNIYTGYILYIEQQKQNKCIISIQYYYYYYYYLCYKTISSKMYILWSIFLMLMLLSIFQSRLLQHNRGWRLAPACKNEAPLRENVNIPESACPEPRNLLPEFTKSS